MSKEDINNLKNVLVYGTPKGTIEVKPHPEDVIEVDPSILIKMQAKLKGESLDDIYGQDERVSSELLIRKETEKLSRIFGNADSVNERFTSIKAINELRKELEFEEVNRDLLNNYSLKATGGQFVDECDLYKTLLDKRSLITKEQRLIDTTPVLESNVKVKFLYRGLQSVYKDTNLEPLKITKEVIYLNPDLRELVTKGFALESMNQLLKAFYGSVTK